MSNTLLTKLGFAAGLQVCSCVALAFAGEYSAPSTRDHWGLTVYEASDGYKVDVHVEGERADVRNGYIRKKLYLHMLKNCGETKLSKQLASCIVGEKEDPVVCQVPNGYFLLNHTQVAARSERTICVRAAHNHVVINFPGIGASALRKYK